MEVREIKTYTVKPVKNSTTKVELQDNTIPKNKYTDSYIPQSNQTINEAKQLKKLVEMHSENRDEKILEVKAKLLSGQYDNDAIMDFLVDKIISDHLYK
jgi:anti-sigma28 factor (negative regulator of flagellin synthesis)